MRGKTLSICLETTLAIFALAIFTSALFVTEASAGTIKVLHNFNGTDGSQPAGVIFDASGNIYGVTTHGGSSNVGLAFELMPTASGWNEKTLIEFNGTNGSFPNPVVFDSAGSLYGTMNSREAPHGTGAIFKLSPTTDGHWDEKTLYTMNNSQGLYPEAPVTFDAAGNLFSTAWEGGAYGQGSVFELSPTAPEGSHEATILSVSGLNGANLACSVVFDNVGNLYGTTHQGGAYNAGTVWELSPLPDGTWTEAILYSFTGGTDGYWPNDGVIFDAGDNLYGTTSSGGGNGFGSVFELSPTGDGGWTKTVLHSFKPTNATAPDLSTLTFDKFGNLYGETATGGTGPCHPGCGVVFELSPDGDGSWTETVLYNFQSTDGEAPERGLIFDAAGNLYGTTQRGGAFGYGTVFEITP